MGLIELMFTDFSGTMTCDPYRHHDHKPCHEFVFISGNISPISPISVLFPIASNNYMTAHDLSDALERFSAHILNSPVKEHIVKIVLFGSRTKATATKDSDIDVLIFTANGKSKEQRIMDDVYDFMMAENLPLEVVTAHIHELVTVQDYFLYTALHSGIEVYSMEKSAMKKIMVRDLLQLCEEYLDSSKDALAIQRVRMAIDAAYNAAELATKALILLEQDDLPGSQGGVVNSFSQLYVKTGKIEKEIGRTLHAALKLRNEARYRPDMAPIPENARFVIDLAEQLMKIASDATLTLDASLTGTGLT